MKDAILKLSQEMLFAAVVAGVKEALHESGVVEEVLQTTRTLQEVKLLKEGLLTYEQAASLLQVSFRTFKRMMEQKQFPKITALGHKEPRVHLSAILSALLADKPVAEGETKAGAGKITALLHPREARRQRAAA